MGKLIIINTQVTLILFVWGLYIMSLPEVVHSTVPEQQFFVEGEVYCEVCRANFINKLSEPMSGARVRLECRGEEDGQVKYSLEGETNDKGVYRLAVEGDHEEETCEVTLLKSSRADCDEIPNEGWAKKPAARVSLTANSGLHEDTRQANPLGFSKREALPECTEYLKELGIAPDELN